MTLTMMPTSSVRKTTDWLLQSRNRLARVLATDAAGREGQWAFVTGNAMDRVIDEVEDHLNAAETFEGPVAEVDYTRPSLVHETDLLARREMELLTQLSDLREELHRAEQIFAQPNLSAVVRPLRPCGNRPVLDFGEIRRQALDILAVLHEIQEAESKLVFESLYTEIGVGD